MSQIKTDKCVYCCDEEIVNIDGVAITTLRPSTSIDVVSGTLIRVKSKYANAIYMFRIATCALTRKTWTSTAMCGYVATVHFSNKKVYKITLIIPENELSYIYSLSQEHDKYTRYTIR
jgi:hypothetical protein